jgi:hypothetical protein
MRRDPLVAVAAIFLDHNVAYAWRFALERVGHSVNTARDRHLEDAKDYDVLGIAAARGWVVITHNGKDFQLLHGAWLSWSNYWGLSLPRAHAGILVLPHVVRPTRAAEIVNEPLVGQSILANRLFIWHPDRPWTEHTATTRLP